MSSSSELACVYSALILYDDDVAITDNKIQTLLSAAKVEVEPFWPSMFAKALEGRNIGDLLCNVGTPGGGGGGGAPAASGDAAAAGGGDAAEAKEEKKEEKEESEESDDDMGFGLFD